MAVRLMAVRLMAVRLTAVRREEKGWLMRCSTHEAVDALTFGLRTPLP